MSLTITHHWKCDICGDEHVDERWTSAIAYQDMKKWVPVGWAFYFAFGQEKHICQKHSISATQNGDTVTIKGAE